MMLHGVLVGIDRYADDRIPTLSCAESDVAALRALLERIKPAERDISSLVNEEATLQAVRRRIGTRLVRDVEEDDIVIVYFACHGSPERIAPQDKRGRYLLPYDADYDDIHSTAIDLDRDVNDWFTRLGRANLVLLVIDACFSGAAGGRTLMGPLLRAMPKQPGYLDDPTPISIRRLNLGRGRVILCAADDDQVALEDVQAGHGVFTRELIRALERSRGGASMVGVGTLYEEIEAVLNEKERQSPVISIMHGGSPRLPVLAPPERT